MTEGIKDIILAKGQALFEEYGYDEVSMRQIAGACGISVGNLTYHFPKKEDLLMTIHDRIMDLFLARIPEKWREHAGLEGYFAAEYAFHRYITETPTIYRMYKQVINSPAMRKSYYERHHLLYLSYARMDPQLPDVGNEEFATIALCALEFHLMETDALLADFDGTFRHIFMARMLFLGLDPEKWSARIDCGIAAGKTISAS